MMMMLESETITTLKRKFSGIKRNDRGMFKAQVTNNGTDRLGELVLESLPVATTESMFNQLQGDMVTTEPEFARLDMFHKTKLFKAGSVEPWATNMSMFNQVQGVQGDIVTSEPEIIRQEMFHKTKFSKTKSVGRGPPTCPCSPRCRGT
jgi:hypothetical protein